MELTLSDQIHLNPDLAPKEPKPKRVLRGPDINWAEIKRDYGVISAAELKEQTGISLTAIYKANTRGDIELAPRKTHDWVLIGKFSPLFTVDRLHKITGIGKPAIEKAIFEGKIICKQVSNIEDRPRSSNGRFTTKETEI